MFSAPRHAKRPAYTKLSPASPRRFLGWSPLSYLQYLPGLRTADSTGDWQVGSEAGHSILKDATLTPDIEAQSPPSSTKPQLLLSVGHEYNVEPRTKLVYLGIWFLLNLVLTIYNKALLQNFAFPWLLTVVHTSFVSVGCYLLLLQGYFQLTPLNSPQQLSLVAFSFLFTINIAMSNVSLAAVSVPFHQIMRSTTPVFTLVIYRVFYSRIYSRSTYLALAPIIVGVGLVTYGDYYFTFIGFVLTILGVALAALKTVISNTLMTGDLALPALEVLLRMSPLAAFQSAIYALITGEVRDFVVYINQVELSWALFIALAGNGFIAFLLNISSFETNKVAGALTMTVAGNLKQCLTIILGIMLFDVKVGILNATGMLITLIGAAWYRKVELYSKTKL